MAVLRVGNGVLFVSLCAALAACNSPNQRSAALDPANPSGYAASPDSQQYQRSSLFDLFQNVDDPNVTLEVNKYIWVASMEVLDFLPLESADPFTGVLVMGYGTPPGGSRAYRATVFVQDPALDARSLNLALLTRNGPAAPATVRAVEDAILTRARQLRIRDGGL